MWCTQVVDGGEVQGAVGARLWHIAAARHGVSSADNCRSCHCDVTRMSTARHQYTPAQCNADAAADAAAAAHATPARRQRHSHAICDL